MPPRQNWLRLEKSATRNTCRVDLETGRASGIEIATTGGNITMKSRILLAAVAAPVLVFAVACSDDDSVSDEAQDLCNSLESLNSTVEQVAGTDLDPSSTTVGDVQDQLGQIQSAVQSVQSAESDLGDAVKSALQDAFNDYESAIQDIPSDDTLAEAGASADSARAAFQQAWTETLSELQCSTS
jgi:ABC-type phosphate/phosphonate transport system substrate-binding protein